MSARLSEVVVRLVLLMAKVMVERLYFENSNSQHGARLVEAINLVEHVKKLEELK